MMSLQAIQQISSEAAAVAARERREPLVIWEDDLNDTSTLRRIPFLGTYKPKGWRRVSIEAIERGRRGGVYMDDNEGYGAYFVDASGFGREGEPALTVGELMRRLQAGCAYAIIEAGQFQVKIGVFKRVVKAASGAARARKGEVIQ